MVAPVSDKGSPQRSSQVQQERLPEPDGVQAGTPASRVDRDSPPPASAKGAAVVDAFGGASVGPPPPAPLLGTLSDRIQAVRSPLDLENLARRIAESIREPDPGLLGQMGLGFVVPVPEAISALRQVMAHPSATSSVLATVVMATGGILSNRSLRNDVEGVALARALIVDAAILPRADEGVIASALVNADDLDGESLERLLREAVGRVRVGPLSAGHALLAISEKVPAESQAELVRLIWASADEDSWIVPHGLRYVLERRTQPLPGEAELLIDAASALRRLKGSPEVRELDIADAKKLLQERAQRGFPVEGEGAFLAALAG
jgi:hypothetical protein